mmetsp:Transcript_108214/g.151023  ORF Transcript_108214/g.151023 Transcript_108214/m.151023 type:complete len:221 (+) Transcript_108214:627-1289(+)
MSPGRTFLHVLAGLAVALLHATDGFRDEGPGARHVRLDAGLIACILLLRSAGLGAAVEQNTAELRDAIVRGGIVWIGAGERVLATRALHTLADALRSGVATRACGGVVLDVALPFALCTGANQGGLGREEAGVRARASLGVLAARAVGIHIHADLTIADEGLVAGVVGEIALLLGVGADNGAILVLEDATEEGVRAAFGLLAAGAAGQVGSTLHGGIAES